ncbi:MAG: DHHA1 domain-containing protein [Bacillota bacterium]|nr:DHHA1 domain-containing protein [Bacillota bacterium]
MTTRQLHLEQPYLRDFAAKVREARELTSDEQAERAHGATAAVVLDASAFYPGGGGQPSDTGRVAGLQVTAVHEDPARPGTVLHFLAGDPPRDDVEVWCEVDWARRYDLMQQHTGQHLISALALERFDAPTTGFHLGEDSATVDLAFPAAAAAVATSEPPDRLQAALDELERLVAAEVFANRPVRVHLTPPGQAPEGADPQLELRIRKRGPAPKGTGLWRVVEIAGVDLSPCGGTHVAATGEIGPVSFERWEKIRDSVRIEFACGWRALAAHGRRSRDIKRLARELSVHEREAVEQALRTLADASALRRRLSEMAETLIGYEAADLARTGDDLPGGRLVVKELPERPAADLNLLAGMVAAQRRCVALLASGGATPRLFFARAADVDLDLRPVLAAAIAEMGGRGGGTPAQVQGGGGDPAALERAMTAAARLARERLAG